VLPDDGSLDDVDGWSDDIFQVRQLVQIMFISVVVFVVRIDHWPRGNFVAEGAHCPENPENHV
jgi:hypothetical protein